MNRLDFAIHRGEELASVSNEPAVRQDARWETWLREDVLPAIEGHLLRPSFQSRALWPLKILGQAADTDEHQMIELFQSRLKSLAEVLMEAVLSNSPGEASTALAASPEETASDSSIGPNPSLIDYTTRKRLDVPSLMHFSLAQVQYMAANPTPRLLEGGNYFLPQLGLLESQQFQNGPQGTNSVVTEAHLLPIGNHLVRHVLEEAQWRSSALIAVGTQILREFGGRMSRQTSLSEALRREWNEFEQVSQRFQLMFHASEEMLQTESCIACTQLYAAVHPSPSLVWMGLPDQAVASGIAGLRNRLWRCLGPALGHRVVIYLETLKQLSMTANSPLEEAIATGGLVIDKRAGTAFWRSQRIELTATQFDFLRALGVSAVQHREIGSEDVSPKKIISDSALSTRLNRLKNRLPQDLQPLVISGKNRATYRFMLPAEKVHLI